MHRKTFLFLAMIGVGSLLFHFPAVAQTTADQATIEKVVSQFFTAYTGGDLERFMALWSAKSPDYDHRKQQMQSLYAAVRDLQMKNLTILKTTQAGNRARVRLTVELTGIDSQTGKPDAGSGKQQIVLYLVIAEGRWQIWRYLSAERDLAEALLAAEKPEDRARLRNADRAAVTAELVELLNEECDTRWRQGKFAEAVRPNDLAFEVANTLDDKAQWAWCAMHRGDLYFYQSQFKTALDNYQQALARFQAANAQAEAGGAQIRIGAVYEETSRFTEALAQFQEGLKVALTVQDSQLERVARDNLGNAYTDLGRYQDALDQFEQTLKLEQAAKDKAGEAGTRVNMSTVYTLTGRYPDALAQYEASLRIAREIGDRQAEEAALNNEGNAYKDMGRYTETLARYEAARKVAEEIHDRAGEAQTRTNLGHTYSILHNDKAALEQFEASLKVFQETGKKQEAATALLYIGEIFRLKKQYDQAIARNEASLALAREIGDKARIASALTDRGNIFAEMGRDQEALKAYTDSFQIDREIGKQLGMVQTMANVGHLYLRQGKYQQAHDVFETILKSGASVLDTLTTAQCYWTLGDTYYGQKQWQDAAQAYRQAIRNIEALHTQAGEQSLQTDLLAHYTQPYYRLADCLLQSGSEAQRAEAFALSEQVKARTLVEILQNGKIDVRQAMTPEERRKEQALADDLSARTVAWSHLRVRPDAAPAEVEAQKQQLDAARQAVEEYRLRLFAAHPELQTQRAQFDPITLTELNQTLFAAEPDMCLLSYLVGDEETLLFVVTRGKEAGAPADLRVYRLPVKAPDLVDSVQRFRLRCATDDGRTRGDLLSRADVVPIAGKIRQTDYRADAHALYDLLIRPAAESLTGKTHLVIIPGDVLHTLPFQALLNAQGQFLIETVSLSYAPSATALVKMRVRADRLRREAPALALPLLAMGRAALNEDLSDLPAAESEVKAIAGLFGTEAIVGKAATKARAIADMGQARYVHFATHGILNPDAPMYSAVVLAPAAGQTDGRLYARELADMRLSAELVVLSACETALGQQTSGEGLLGLSWALFVAGTPSSIVSQWPVADESTRDLMVAFYQRLKTAPAGKPGGIGKAEALRAAQLQLLHDGKHAHPFYWAPFVLVGDWK